LRRSGCSSATLTEAADYPQLLRTEVRAYLARRGVQIGRRRLFTSGDRLTSESGRRRPLRRLWSFGGFDLAASRLSRDAVRDVLEATPHQLDMMSDAGLLRKGAHSWTPAVELDGALDRLARLARARSSADRTAFVSLAAFSGDGGDALPRHLRDVLQGITPCATWSHISPPSLSNLFIPRALAARYRVGSDRCCS
jgi:hypothetical protein